MQVLVDEKQNVPYSSYGYVNNKAVEAEKVDDLTVKISLGSSSAGFLGGLSQVYCIPKHIYDGVENTEKVISTMNRWEVVLLSSRNTNPESIIK